MADKTERNFVYPQDVSAFGFDWGRLALTVAPEVNGAEALLRRRRRPAVRARATPATTIPARKRSSSSSPAKASRWSRTRTASRWCAKVGPGCTVYVPESRFHSTLNTGDGPMQLFVVYSPAGPELALRELPDFRLFRREDHLGSAAPHCPAGTSPEDGKSIVFIASSSSPLRGEGAGRRMRGGAYIRLCDRHPCSSPGRDRRTSHSRSR